MSEYEKVFGPVELPDLDAKPEPMPRRDYGYYGLVKLSKENMRKACSKPEFCICDKCVIERSSK